jgi:hypothetical protein
MLSPFAHKQQQQQQQRRQRQRQRRQQQQQRISGRNHKALQMEVGLDVLCPFKFRRSNTFSIQANTEAAKIKTELTMP